MTGLIRRGRLALGVGLGLTLVLGVAGQVVRDRSMAWGWLMYLPVVPLGLLAVAIDLASRGRALPRGRFALGSIGLAAALGVAWPMIGLGPEPDSGTGPGITLLHWNVLWGGGQDRDPAKWAAIRREILGRGADLVVLSEAPPDDWLDQLVGELGPGGHRVDLANDRDDGYWFRLAVLSRGPLRLARVESIADGAGAVVEAEIRGRTIRLLVVDAQSSPMLSRAPRLLDVADACRRAEEMGEPIDVIAGDLNTVSTSLDFDAIEGPGPGYTLASRSSRGWRGTFPALLPIYDIDHVLVRRANRLLECRIFTNLASDHRGQVVRFRPPG